MSALVLTATPLAAARAARRLCDAEGGILFGPAVTTLDRLAPALLAEAGERRPILTPLAFRLVAAEAGRTAGGPFAGVRAEDGLGAGLANALAELRAAEVTGEEAHAAAETLAGAARERLLALARALERFEGRLAALGALDDAAAAREAASLVRRGAPPPGVRELELLVVDGIGSLSPARTDLLAALVGRARRARLEVPFFPERPDLSAPAERLLRRLEEAGGAGRGVEIVLRRLEEGRAPRLAALLGAFAGGRPAPDAAALAGRVAALASAGEEGEPEAVARAVEALADAGLAPEEIAVVAPAPRHLAAPLARAMAGRGLPFSPGRGPPLGEAPVVRIALEALRSASGGHLGRAAAERLTASTYLTARELPPIGPVLDAAGAVAGRSAPLEALRRRAAALAPGAVRARGATQRAADAVARAEAAVRALSGSGPARTHAARLSAFLDASGLRRRAGHAPEEIAAADLAALSRLEEAAESVARAVGLAGRGHEALSAEEFAALLGSAVDEASSAAPPGPAAGAVELWSLGEAAGLSARGVVIAGCGRGWPPPPPADPMLRDPERTALARTVRRVILPLASGRRAESLHRAFCAVAAAREAVTFTWGAPGPSGAAGRGGPVSPLVADALRAVGAPLPRGPDAPPSSGEARTPREALRAAARAGSAASLAATALAERAGSALARGAVETARRSGHGPHAGTVAGLALPVLQASLPPSWSPSQLERYAECPFRLFLAKQVRLPDESPPDLDAAARDEGTLLHRALELFVSGRMARGAWPPRGTPEDEAELRAAAAAALAGLEGEGRAGDPAVWAGRREVLVARLLRFVSAEAERAGPLLPVAVELRFGGKSAVPPLAVEAGGVTVLLEGRIDRVDASPGRLRVVDYKSGRSDSGEHDAFLEPGGWGERSFQVPAYLLAAARAFPGRVEQEARYAFLRTADVKERSYSVSGGALEGADAFARRVVALVARVRAGEFPQVPGGCERCPWPAVCRPERAAREAGS